ncbi:MAG TPA: cytochrome c oxidase subunit 3 [Actinomycetes bacterium]
MSGTAIPIRSGEERAVAGTSSSVLGMVLFVASESMFFAAFFGAYVNTYVNQKVWPPNNTPAPPLSLATAAVASLVLSGLLLQGAFRAARRGLPGTVSRWLVLTLAAAVASVVLTLVSYAEVGFGLHAGIFASLFYLMTGLGLAHVAGGVVLLALVVVQSLTGRLALVRYQPVQAAAVYWNFVVVLGLVIYVVFYVLTNTGG